jgi:hypothetical protein
MRFSTDGVNFGAWQPFAASAPFTLPSGDGTKTVFVQFRNGAGAISATQSDSIVLDTAPPTSVAVAPLATFQKSTAFTVHWSATDSGSGVKNFDVQQRIATPTSGFGPWTTILSATTATSHVITGTPGDTRQYRVRARDNAGNVSAFSAAKSTAVPVDDPSLAVTSGSWTRLTGQTGTYRTTISRSNAVGDMLATGSVTAQRIAVLVTKASGYGTIQIRWNGTLKATVSLNNASTLKKQYIVLTAFASPQTGNLTIRHSAGGRVDIDGVALRRN